MMVASELPHFIGVDDDVLSTGVVLYHLQVRTFENATCVAGVCHLLGECVYVRHVYQAFVSVCLSPICLYMCVICRVNACAFIVCINPPLPICLYVRSLESQRSAL